MKQRYAISAVAILALAATAPRWAPHTAQNRAVAPGASGDVDTPSVASTGNAAAASPRQGVDATSTDAVPRPAMSSEAALDRYYEALEQRAKARGRIDDELPKAVEAYKEARGVFGPERASLKLRAFGDRLKRVSRQQHIAPTLAELDSLVQRIGEEKNAARRAQLSSEYASASARLPPVERLEASDRLQALALRY
jgi:hypothetical protein